MDFSKGMFKVEFTEQCIEEMTEIYEYISNNLKASKAAQRLINDMNAKVMELSNNPELYIKIGKVDRLKREYHRIVIRNYVVLYTVDYDKMKVYISRMIYGRRNYLN